MYRRAPAAPYALLSVEPNVVASRSFIPMYDRDRCSQVPAHPAVAEYPVGVSPLDPEGVVSELKCGGRAKKRGGSALASTPANYASLWACESSSLVLMKAVWSSSLRPYGGMNRPNFT